MQPSSAQARDDAGRDISVTRDHVRLSMRLWLPAGTAAFPCVIFVHGRGSSKDSPRNVVIAAHLVDAGIAALLFDLNGHGDSSADPREDGASYVDDLAAVFAWAQTQPEVDADRIGVAGSSLGAVVAVDAALTRRAYPAAMVLRAPPVEEDDFAQLRVPSLVVIGSLDPLFASVRDAAGRSDAVTLSVVRGAGHLFEEPGTLGQALDRTVSWFEEKLRPQTKEYAAT